MKQLANAIEMLKNGQTAAFKLNANEVLAVTKNALVLRTTNESNRESNNFAELILAARVNGAIVGNSSQMRTRLNQDITERVQRPLSNLIPMVPFNALKQAGLSIRDFRELDKGNEETVYVKSSQCILVSEFQKLHASKKGASISNVRKGYSAAEIGDATWLDARHFTGARLFSVGAETFLLDIDRGEIEHGIFNAFLVKLTVPATSIAQAYESLKPEAVKLAERQGVKVLRQGEWFFIPSETVPANVPTDARMALRAGNNRPNWVERGLMYDGVAIVSGEITHSGREHMPITLDTWHVAVPNTSITSWQLNGDID